MLDLQTDVVLNRYHADFCLAADRQDVQATSLSVVKLSKGPYVLNLLVQWKLPECVLKGVVEADPIMKLTLFPYHRGGFFGT